MQLQVGPFRMALLVCVVIAFIAGSAGARSPLADTLDVKIADRDERESSVFVSPLDPRVVLVSNNVIVGSGASDGVSGWISMDGGATWDSTSSVVGPGNCDPACVISKAQGTYGRIIVNYIGAQSRQAVSYKDSPTSSWTAVTVYELQGDSADKNHLWVDNASTGNYANYLYCGWNDYAQVRIARKRPSDTQWPAPVEIDHLSLTPTVEARFGVNINSNSSGHVYAVWANNTDSANGEARSLGFSKSTDGGASWTTEDTTQTGLKGFGWSSGTYLLGDGKTMRVTTYPSMTVDLSTDHIYVVWASFVSSGPKESNIYLIKSTDGGDTWSPKKRVNQDSSGLAKDQWHPWITWDACTGALAVVYLDSRDQTDRVHTYVSVSYDTSASWQDFRVSDTEWTGDCCTAPGYEYIGIAAGDGRAYPVWSDERQSGNMRPWVSPFLLWGVEQDSVSASFIHGTSNTIDVTVAWATNLSATEGDQIILVSPASGTHTTYTSPACTTCTTNGGKTHSLTYEDLAWEPGYWTYTARSSRSECTSPRQSDVDSLFVWGVIQSSVAASYTNVVGNTIDVTATWTTNLSATAGDQIVLTSPVTGTHTTYTSAVCTNCWTGGGTNHSLTFADVPCEPGYWTYRVRSSRSDSGTHQSGEKTFRVIYCLD